jgi:hypothetical protein
VECRAEQIGDGFREEAQTLDDLLIVGFPVDAGEDFFFMDGNGY